MIAVDGKTSRRSYRKKGSKQPIHMVSAFAARQRLVMGQIAVAEKSNEIVAIPALLDMMAIEGAVVTIDAMGCQRHIAGKIIDSKADYIIALKGNQGTLHDDVKLLAAEQKVNGFKDVVISRHETVDGDHGRIETRSYTVFHDVEWLQQRHDWPGLKAVVMVESQREIEAKISNETRFYITSLDHARQSDRADDPRSLGNRERAALGARHDLSRRRMQGPNRQCARQLHNPKAHGKQRPSNRSR